MLPLVQTTEKKTLISIIMFKVSIHVIENKGQEIYTIKSYVFSIFYCHVSKIVNKNVLYDFLSNLILFGTKFSIVISLKE